MLKHSVSIKVFSRKIKRVLRIIYMLKYLKQNQNYKKPESLERNKILKHLYVSILFYFSNFKIKLMELNKIIENKSEECISMLQKQGDDSADA